MSRVIHFEIPSDEPEKAQQFYSKVFGWKMRQWVDQPYWLCTTGDKSLPGIDGAIIKKRGPDHPLVNTIQVDHLEETITNIEANGGIIVVPKMAVPGIGWLAFFKDTDGNIMGIMQSDTQAK